MSKLWFQIHLKFIKGTWAERTHSSGTPEKVKWSHLFFLRMPQWVVGPRNLKAFSGPFHCHNNAHYKLAPVIPATVAVHTGETVWSNMPPFQTSFEVVSLRNLGLSQILRRRKDPVSFQKLFHWKLSFFTGDILGCPSWQQNDLNAFPIVSLSSFFSGNGSGQSMVFAHGPAGMGIQYTATMFQSPSTEPGPGFLFTALLRHNWHIINFTYLKYTV